MLGVVKATTVNIKNFSANLFQKNMYFKKYVFLRFLMFFIVFCFYFERICFNMYFKEYVFFIEYINQEYVFYSDYGF